MTMLGIMRTACFIFICLLGLVVSDNSTIGDQSNIQDVSEITNAGSNLDGDSDQGMVWGEWSPWSKWSSCTRSCGAGISRQQRRCRRKPCKGRPWTTRYKICNPQACEKGNDFRAEQCAAFDDVPYSGQLLKWYPHYDPSRPCALICRGEQSLDSGSNRMHQDAGSAEKVFPVEASEILQLDSDETIVVQLADKVEDGTKCYPQGLDVCINGECMKVGCDLRVGSNRNTDACGVCGGNGSSCQSRYSWSLESISVCSESCGGGYKIARGVCKVISPDESVVDDNLCDPDSRPEKTLMPCNTHPCTTKWVTGEWSMCSLSCGGGTRTRAVFCTEENGNETTKLPDHKCSGTHKPRSQETCNTISCPMWETNKWSECSVTCGSGVRTRMIECRNAMGGVSKDCDPTERPHSEQECKTNIACPTYGEDMTQPLMQPYPPPPVSEKLIDQPVPSESTFIAEEWSPCSVTCGEGIRHREVHCKIFLEFSRTIAMLPDRQCSGPKPVETEKCELEPCVMENSLTYGMDTVGDSGYAEPSLTDSYRSSAAGGSGSGFDGGIKVAPGSDVQTTYSWKEAGYTSCSASCLGGVQDLIINCVRDDTGRTVIPLLCTAETKPEARIRVCNDHPCPPRWNYSDFSPCLSPCGIGIQTRDVVCIHEVTRKSVPVPNNLCPQPPPADRRYCNVLDCPVKWNTGEWGKCSKPCGGGVKRRNVTCEQIMAQGRKQSREDRECPSQRPSTQKPCNTQACSDLNPGASPLISSQNKTFNQTNINEKVDVKIGGIAMVLQGTPFIKIRCPVRKFDKSQLIWTKDNKELRKSRKYKISKKGALKINDITSNDSGVYACIAGNSHAETQLIVKFRSKEQISSEEFLRLSNSVQLQRNANLDSAPVNSGESFYTDRAAAYGNSFVPIDSEDLSHERAVTSKPTRKPHQKKQKTSPTPPDSTMMHKEHTVTSLNQPGYHESVESTVPSSASTLVPHLTYFISALKEYWPFQGEASTGRTHKSAPVALMDDVHKNIGATKRTMPDRKSGLRYQSVEDNLDTLYRNTVIPDETFGPDEERIFIDVDPYDLDESIFNLEPSAPVKFTPVVKKSNPPTPAKPEADDYVEESLKSVKVQLHNATSKNPVHKANITTGDIGLDLYYIPDGDTRGVLRTAGLTSDDIIEPERKNHENFDVEEPSNVPAEITAESIGNISKQKVVELEKNQFANKTDDYSDIFEEELRKRRVEPYEEDETADYGTERTTTKDFQEVLEDAMSTDHLSTITDKSHETDPRNLSRNREDFEKAFDITQNTELPVTSVHNEEKASESLDVTASITHVVPDTTTDPSLPMITLLDNTEDMIVEWVTTEWSKCSQTCGGSGFQMRGAQCTMRSSKPIGNSTRAAPRTVVSAALCENAGHTAPQKVRACGFGKCPQWHTTNWTTCETSRCFNWKTAMQRRDVTCRLVDDIDSEPQNVTILDPNKCDDATRPLQRQECYNDACKGVWRVGEWSECTAACEENGIKYRILQCVWFGTKKPAGNACRDIPRPPVMKTCRGALCSQDSDDCKDLSQLCSRVKMMNMCKVPLYQKQCCKSCR